MMEREGLVSMSTFMNDSLAGFKSHPPAQHRIVFVNKFKFGAAISAAGTIEIDVSVKGDH
eukprot:CAMPEP_0114502136 /NCGR_PEP_ID=MMETSP0109-20121206/8883_1 /TAXON_ID=29199 /ORGANISM="Chlorarachnion reptans, Strain CCCM449" /LENGTH=59 /DNA_ID=CAMNT_0001679937 /DNA_START=165 /DNA_END=344 /DNA_ORIENTATION=+